MNEKVTMPPIFVICGFATLVLFLIVIVSAVCLDGDWEFGHETFSSLGVSKNLEARTVFNFGCVMVGLLGLFFGLGMTRHENNWLYLSGLLTIVCCISLMGVGAVQANYDGDAHSILAKLFGLFSALAMIVSAIGDFYAGRKIYAAIPIILLLFSAVMLFLREYPLFEAVSVISILVWMAIQSFKYLIIVGKTEYENPLSKLVRRNDQ